MRSHSRLDHGSKNRQVVDLMTEDTTPELRRSFKPQWVFAIALGSAVGWGAFILPFDWMTTGGLGGTVIGFHVGGLDDRCHCIELPCRYPRVARHRWGSGIRLRSARAHSRIYRGLLPHSGLRWDRCAQCFGNCSGFSRHTPWPHHAGEALLDLRVGHLSTRGDHTEHLSRRLCMDQHPWSGTLRSPAICMHAY